LVKKFFNFSLVFIDDRSNINCVMKEQTTKERILEAAEELMLEKSFHSVGLKQILDTVKVPKGSFYYYFESKEQFGAEMMKHYMGEVSVRKREQLLSKEMESDPLKRLFAYLDGSIDLIQEAPGKFPCLALKLASEVSDLNETMCKELAKGFEDWTRIYQEVLNEAVEKKALPADFDTESEAKIIQDLWSGAIHRAVINRDVEPVRHAVDFIKARISSMTA